jgi:hypothetical protein
MQQGATENARKSDAALKVYLLELNMQGARKDSGGSEENKVEGGERTASPTLVVRVPL